MKTNVEELRKHFILLKQTFWEVARIRHESEIHHGIKEDNERNRTHIFTDLFDGTPYKAWGESYELGLGWAECLLNKANWNRKELFKIAANVELKLHNGEERIYGKKWYNDKPLPVPLDKNKVEELVQQGLINMGKFEKEL